MSKLNNNYSGNVTTANKKPRFSTPLLAIAAILVIILPLALIIGMIYSIPPQYANTFVGELDEKYERLYSIDEPKIVVVGGSSVAFGLESELIEKYISESIAEFGSERAVLGRMKELLAYWAHFPSWARVWRSAKMARTIEELKLSLCSL